MSRWIWVLVVAGCATVFGVAGAIQEYVSVMPGTPRTMAFGHALIMALPYWYVWAILLPAMMWFSRRHPFERSSLRRDISLHVAFAIAITGLQTMAHVWFMHVAGHGFPRGAPVLPNLLHRTQINFLSNLLAYVLILALVFVVLFYQRLRDRETAAARLANELSQANLHALRMQLNPHFLFNALNAVSMLVRQDNGAGAVRMLGRLAGLLRTMLDETPAHEWPLSEELRFVRQYLEIEQVRFGDRLQVVITTSPKLEDCLVPTTTSPKLEDYLVPTLILQPLIENAVRHGIANRSGAGWIGISISQQDGELLIKLEDDGAGFDRDVQSRGLGLENTRARLGHLYGDGERLSISDRPGCGTSVELRIPLHTELALSVTA